jgi:hypothetical protein
VKQQTIFAVLFLWQIENVADVGDTEMAILGSQLARRALDFLRYRR